MQLAIIGTEEEISEIIKYVQNMQVISQTERVVRAEFSSRIEERTQLQFEGLSQTLEKSRSM